MADSTDGTLKRPRPEDDGAKAAPPPARKRRSAWDTGAPTGSAAASSAATATPAERVATLQSEIAKLQAQIASTVSAVGIPEEQRSTAVAALNAILSKKTADLVAAQAAAAGGANPAIAASAASRLAAALANVNASLIGAGAVPGVLGGGSAAAAAGAANPARVYVGSMHYDVGEFEVRQLFSPFGRIVKVDMSFEPSTGKTRGYAFLTFDTAEAAAAAIEGMNGFQLAGRPIRVSRPAGAPVDAAAGGGAASAPSATGGAAPDLNTVAAQRAALSYGVPGGPGAHTFRVYVGAVPYEMLAEHVHAIFSPFGSIRSVTLLPSTDPTSGSHRGYGFIEFEEEAAGKAAIEAMSGFEVGGRKLKVNAATSQTAPAVGGAGGGMGMGMLGGGVAPIAPMNILMTGGGAGLGGYGGGAAALPPQSALTYGGGAPLDVSSIAAAAAAAVMGSSAPLPPLPAGRAPPLPAAAPPPLPPQSSAASRVVAVANMVDAVEAADAALPEEVREEAARYGAVDTTATRDGSGVRVHVHPGGARVTVFVSFRDAAGAAAAQAGMHSRNFGGRVTSARLYPEDAYAAGDFEA